MENQYWRKETRDGWFFAALALASVGVAWVFWPYLYVLLVAVVTVVVSWPLHKRVIRVCEGKKAMSAFLTTVLMAILVFGPLSYLVYLFAAEINSFIMMAQDAVEGGLFQQWVDQGLGTFRQLAAGGEDSWLPGFVTEAMSNEAWIVENLQKAATQVLTASGEFLTTSLPSLLSLAVNFSIDVVIYVFTVVTLYMEGPAILTAIKRLSPLADEYEDRLFHVFGEFSLNMVVGSVATAAIQGVVASIGYAIVGVDRIIFLGVATAVLSFVPLVGTLAVWIPVTFYVGFTMGWGWALFVVIWSIVFTGTVDNLARPLFMRGSTDIHPLLVFLSVFGGMYWMGIPGVLVGPVIVAFFLALYTIYLEDFLGYVTEDEESGEPGLMGRWVAQIKTYFSGKSVGTPDTVETEASPEERESDQS